ncbi:MAG: hypothetical protein O3A66_01385, partial [Proteobacteria bacterium]|nr:hypothetical protein [Pseudomonadota bacterium]
MKISKFGKTIIITISVLLFFVALYVYSSLKTNSSGYTKLRENFIKNLTVVTRGTKFDAVIFQGKSLNILKSSFSHN